MECILHEKQEGSLCAQHCLNALLQGPYFTAVELADLARQLDESERQHMAEGGMNSDDYKKFLEQPSSNFDDSGFFSIQVLQKALRVWNLDLMPYTSSSEVATAARNDPTSQMAYICNFKEHWFTIRKLGNQWFNLNSLLSGAELISNTYLSMFLTQLQQEGYAIFMVMGDLPPNDADQMLKLMPAIQPVKPDLLTDAGDRSKSNETAATGAQGDDEYRKVMEESQKLARKMEEEELQAVLAMSMSDNPNSGPSTSTGGLTNNISEPPPLGATAISPDHTNLPDSPPSAEEVRQKRLAFLGRLEQKTLSEDTQSSVSEDTPSSSKGSPASDSKPLPSEMTEDEMLEAAIKMSMESS